MDKRKFILNHKIISSEFNKLLNKWDFLHVIDKDNQTEYSDLIGPFITQLQETNDKVKLEQFVHDYITDRYGYTPQRIDIFIEKMLKWWNEIDKIIICRKYGAKFAPALPNTKIGIAKNIKDNILPINGLRHKEGDGTCGWYIWRGEEISKKDDFFQPIHVSHLKEYCPEVIEYLGLPPGWRFLLAPDQTDAWFDDKLL